MAGGGLLAYSGPVSSHDTAVGGRFHCGQSQGPSVMPHPQAENAVVAKGTGRHTPCVVAYSQIRSHAKG